MTNLHIKSEAHFRIKVAHEYFREILDEGLLCDVFPGLRRLRILQIDGRLLGEARRALLLGLGRAFQAGTAAGGRFS